MYPTAWHRLRHQIALRFQGSATQFDDKTLAGIYGEVLCHASIIGQFPDGLRVLDNITEAGTSIDPGAGRAWVSSTLEEMQARLVLLTEALSSPEPTESGWQQAEQSIAEMYSKLNALQILCQRRGKLDYTTQVTTLSALPCMFPVGDEAGSGVVWMSVEESQYGVYVSIHKQHPGARPQPYEGMAAIHVDYFDNCVQLQIYDEDFGPGGDTHWGRVQDPYGLRDALDLDLPPHVSGCSIILVQDVEQWKEPDEQAGQ
jgi:hypothetical protein